MSQKLRPTTDRGDRDRCEFRGLLPVGNCIDRRIEPSLRCAQRSPHRRIQMAVRFGTRICMGRVDLRAETSANERHRLLFPWRAVRRSER